jgi:hypothetical protein
MRRRPITLARAPWAAVAAVATFSLLAALAAGALAIGVVDIRYANIPVVHPYPPAGWMQNPFNPSDRSDVVSIAQAARAKRDLLADGQVEISAAGTGDTSRIAEADTARSLDSVRQLLAANASADVLQETKVHLDSVTVGKLADPNDRAISWCLEEYGSTTLTFVQKRDGAIARTNTMHFKGRFWLVNVNGRYLIADRLVTSQ